MAWPLSLFSCEISEASPDDLTARPKSEGKRKASALPSALLDLLQYYERPGLPPPPSARVGDLKLKQRQSQPVRLWHLWKYGAFVAMKATEVIGAVLLHHIRGPPKKSWGIEMTLMNCLMRDASRHSHLADIATIRVIMGIGGLVPLPSDALVTPVTFRVRKRDLRGILADFDAAEDDTRELSGEWVVGKRTWQRLQHEWKASKKAKSRSSSADSDSSFSPSPTPQAKQTERVILYLHGGAYYMFSPATHRLITIPLTKALNARLFAVDYRLAPETRFPGPLHDAVSTYFRMIDDLHISPENIIVAGDSAGGALSLALMMYLRDNDYPLPGGAILMSPWVDLTMSCDSWEGNAKYDVVPMPQPGDHLNPIACYLGEHMEKYLTHPYASPLFGDLRGLPPMLVQAGDSEVLRDEITLLAHKATLAGVEIRHELYEDAVHVFQSYPFLDASRRAFISCREFVREVLPRQQISPPLALQDKAEEKLEHEIDNDNARVVQGDGTVSVAGREDVRKSLASHPLPPKTEPSLSSGDDPSWGLLWPTPPTPPSSRDEEDPREKSGHVRAQTAPLRNLSDATASRSRKCFSLVSFRAADHPRPTGHTHHRRISLSQYSAHAKDSAVARNPTRGYRTSPLNMSTSTAPAPQPSIRRTHSSHPDISSLCKQWADSGPANQTLTFRPGASPRRKHSQTVSFSSRRGYIL